MGTNPVNQILSGVVGKGSYNQAGCPPDMVDFVDGSQEINALEDLLKEQNPPVAAQLHEIGTAVGTLSEVLLSDPFFCEDVDNHNCSSLAPSQPTLPPSLTHDILPSPFQHTSPSKTQPKKTNTDPTQSSPSNQPVPFSNPNPTPTQPNLMPVVTKPSLDYPRPTLDNPTQTHASPSRTFKPCQTQTIVSPTISIAQISPPLSIAQISPPNKENSTCRPFLERVPSQAFDLDASDDEDCDVIFPPGFTPTKEDVITLRELMKEGVSSVPSELQKDFLKLVDLAEDGEIVEFF